jgi:hypothetical protein
MPVVDMDMKGEFTLCAFPNGDATEVKRKANDRRRRADILVSSIP